MDTNLCHALQRSHDLFADHATRHQRHRQSHGGKFKCLAVRFFPRLFRFPLDSYPKQPTIKPRTRHPIQLPNRHTQPPSRTFIQA